MPRYSPIAKELRELQRQLERIVAVEQEGHNSEHEAEAMRELKASVKGEIVRLRNEIAHATTVFVSHQTRVKYEPPHLAEFMLTLLSAPDKREAILGDFDELFERDVAKVGSSRARLRYWGRTIRSIGPLLWQLMKKVGIVGLVTAAIKRLAGG